MLNNIKNHHIYVLTKWIEDNLHTELDIATVCRKSGYSERHLQRIFKEVAGITLADYILRRRMFKCAIAIKTTLAPMETIASRYQFNSLSSFSKAFTRIFGVSPKNYRGRADTNFNMLPIKIEAEQDISALDVSYVCINELELYGLSGSYQISPYEVDRDHILKRAPLEECFSQMTKSNFDEVYSLTEYTSNVEAPDIITVNYSIGIKMDSHIEIPSFHPLPPVFGDFIMVSCVNPTASFFEICESMYWKVIFRNGLLRRQGLDVEKITWKPDANGNIETSYSFMVPVVFNEQVHKLLSTTFEENFHKP
ncbi:AraC family transcriptional regulator [Klebsiella aerogenes]|uniref:AraC family transcriptional regulator n=1 Tax=Klebsiella aerogenes TaxID=548 RepID=UPI00254DFDE6|nr:AraC family transcriptional regulator [Klebsiella aerogenes]MDK7100071.1 AraC family transcriptional regulator [Klebsiella aerogenes]MDK7645558.1 AraC family transcriptional regulator [Klebsiella aerogenes]MDK7850443.1 AraC family transcriptional regulator [Klebsiella aerogenes]MDK8313048.1 AraC family transcriptional regulator [Klebsiella aerogenes]